MGVRLGGCGEGGERLCGVTEGELVLRADMPPSRQTPIRCCLSARSHHDVAASFIHESIQFVSMGSQVFRLGNADSARSCSGSSRLPLQLHSSGIDDISYIQSTSDLLNRGTVGAVLSAWWGGVTPRFVGSQGTCDKGHGGTCV